MNIENPTQLYQFLANKGITGICPEGQSLVACMDALLRMCACDPPQAKQAKFNQCRQIYIAFASKAPSMSAILLSKSGDNRITFYLNGQLISSIGR